MPQGEIVVTNDSQEVTGRLGGLGIWLFLKGPYRPFTKQSVDVLAAPVVIRANHKIVFCKSPANRRKIVFVKIHQKSA